MTLFTDDLPEQPGAHNDSDYLAQNEQADENSTSEGHDQATTEHQPDDPGSAAHAVDHFDEGDSSNDADPEQEQPADDTESTVGPLSGDERTEQPVGVAEEDREQGAAIVANSDGGYPGPAEDPNAAAVHEHPDDHDVAPFGENSTGHEEVVPTNDDYESDYNENDQDSVHGDTVAIEGDAGDADWATTTPDAQHTQGNLERHKDQDAEEADKREQVTGITSTGDLTSPPTDSDPIDLNAPDDDDDYNTGQQGKQLPHPPYKHRLNLRQTPTLTHLDNEHWTNLQMHRKKLKMIPIPAKEWSRIILQVSVDYPLHSR